MGTRLSCVQRPFCFVSSGYMLRFGWSRDGLGEFRRIDIAWMQENDWKFQERTKREVRRRLTLM
jgi:hypothetical protein